MIKIPFILSLYLARIFSVWTGILLAIFSNLIIMFEFVELIRRSSTKAEVSIGTVIKMTLFKSPLIIQQLFPLIVLLAAVLTFKRLQTHFELIIMRANGASIAQILTPLLIVVFFFSCIDLIILNPLSSGLKRHFEVLELTTLRKKASQLTLSDTGLWLKQKEEKGYTIIRAERINMKEKTLSNVSLFFFDEPDFFKENLSSKVEFLKPGFWDLSSGSISKPHVQSTYFKRFIFKTDFTLEGIEDHFTPPETLSFWELPSFIKTLEKAGFSGTLHRFYWMALLVKPFVMMGMVLVAACFSFQWKRNISWGWVIFKATLLAFFLYIMMDIMKTLALSMTFPINLALWGPVFGIFFVTIAFLLHVESS